MDRLQQFYLDEATRDDVKNFMMNVLEEVAVERVFGGKDVVGILEAKELIEKSFSKLEEIYKVKKEVKQDSAE